MRRVVGGGSLVTMSFVFVDLDGTILDMRARQYQVYKAILEPMGDRILELASFWELKRQRASTASVLLASGARVEPARFDEEWLERIESPSMLSLDTLQPGAIWALRSLRSTHEVVVVTMRRRWKALCDQLGALGLLSEVDAIIVCQPEARKDETVGRELGGRVDVVSSHWVGDTEVDIEAGTALGVTTWAVTCGIRDGRLLLRARPHYVCESLAQVAGAVAAGRAKRV